MSGAQYTYVTGVSQATNVDLTDAANESKMTESDAISEAMNFLSKMGIDGMEKTSVEPLVRIWSNDDGDVLQSKVDGYSILLNRTIYGAKTGMGTIYNVDNLQSQNGYMMDINDYAIMCINDDGIISMYADLYTDTSSLKDEDVNILSWDDMIAKANENIAAYYEKYQTRYGKIAFNKVEL